MHPKLYAFMRGMNLQPEEAVEQTNPAVAEVLTQIQVLLEGALGKAPTPRQPGSRKQSFLRQLEQNLQEPAIPGMPERPDAAELLRRATPVEPPFAPITPKEKPKILEIAAKRTKTGRIHGAVVTLDNGRTFETTITARDELGRITCVDYGGRFQLRTVRDAMGKIVKLVPAEDYGGAPGKFGQLN